ncbi:hypothetical protein [Mangrovimonas sp. ST2L15]|uniref:hypothetical protein n=1 Tax=Mangrovimonas sp. ST2L15 TaxID=1645916 RepID=UPI0006B5E021|nr:hypothetical protein [Mangrovimonas sp. ST2L15]
MIRKFSILVMVLVFLSCQPVLRTVTGIKKPQVESIHSLKKYIQEESLPVDLAHNFYLSAYTAYQDLAIFRDSLFRLPDTYLFNKNGGYVEETQMCLVKKKEDDSDANYYDMILEDQELQFNEKSISQIEGFIIDQHGDSVRFPENQNIAIVLWAKFMGSKKNRKILKTSNQQLKDSNKNIQIYYLNLDMLNFWPEEEASIE